MTVGFIVICVTCGNETMLTTEKDKRLGYYYFDSDNETLKLARDTNNMQDTIHCLKCNSKIVQDY